MQEPITATTPILLVPGSLRAASVNRAALPPFNPDDDLEDGSVRAAVTDLRSRLGATDAVLFCVPEYAGTVPRAFKNLLDWAVGRGELYGKPVAWINASSRPSPEAGRGAHQAVRTVLGYTGADLAETACRRIRVPRRAVGPDGVVADESLREQIAAVVVALARHAAAARTSNGFRPAA